MPVAFLNFEGNVEDLAAALGIGLDDMDRSYPIVYAHCGTWTLLVPIKRVEPFVRMKPDNKRFAGILKEMPTASVHPFSTETIGFANDLHGRHFSASHSGTIEDPVTGTASGGMAAYYITYIKKINHAALAIEQGQEMGRDGLVKAEALRINDGVAVSISGTAVFIEERCLAIEN